MNSELMWPHRLAWPRTSDSHSEDRGSNPHGATKNLSLVLRGERTIAMINRIDRGYFYVFTFQRLRALSSDGAASFEHPSLLVCKISTD